MAANLVPNPMFVAAVDVAFLPACAILMAKLVIKAGNKRNLFFVPVLLLLAAFNGLSHAGVVFGNAEWGVSGGYGELSTRYERVGALRRRRNI